MLVRTAFFYAIKRTSHKGQGENMIDGKIYKFQNKLNGKVYIGQTIADIRTRYNRHKHENRTYFEKATTKYGIENFDFKVIDRASTMEELNAKEVFWIAFFNSMYPNGYNLCEGGESVSGFKHSEESKEKMRQARQRNIENGVVQGMTGKRHSETTKETIRKKKTGVKTGKHYPMSEESKKRMIEKRRGSKASEETIEKMRNSKQNRKVICVETGVVYRSQREASRQTGFNCGHLSVACNTPHYTVHGTHWKFVE